MLGMVKATAFPMIHKEDSVNKDKVLTLGLCKL